MRSTNMYSKLKSLRYNATKGLIAINKRLKIICISITIIYFTFHVDLGFSQTLNSVSQMDSILPGTWKGTSICHIKGSPCNNETIVYHISKIASGKYQIIANKIVAEREEEMGTLNFQYLEKDGSITCINPKNETEWSFICTNSTLNGILISKNQLFRFIQVKKER